MTKKRLFKPKEPVRIRFKQLANKNQSIYLDIYNNGRRSYKFLKLYLVPEIDSETKTRNAYTLQLASRIKSQKIIELTNNTAGVPNQSITSSMPLIDWMMHFRMKKLHTGQSGSFGRLINSTAKYLAQYSGEKTKLKDIDKPFCSGFLDFLNQVRTRTGKRLSKMTIINYWQSFNCALNEAVRNESIPANPVKKMDNSEKLKMPESNREFLSIEEVKKLMETDCRREVVKQAYLFSCFCGLRWSDIEMLKWNDIIEYEELRGKRYQIKVLMKKTQRTVYIPLSEEALNWIPKKDPLNHSERVFVLPHYVNANIILKQWIKKCGITKHITFHTARHTFATMGITAGVDIYTISKLLGHSNIVTTQIYTKIIDEKKTKAVDLVSHLFQ